MPRLPRSCSSRPKCVPVSVLSPRLQHGSTPLLTTSVRVMLAPPFRHRQNNMARPASVPITRLRFRGRTETLNAICQVFREHPHVSLSATDVAEYAQRDFRDVHERLSETPELFVHLRKKRGESTRYRLTSDVEKMGVAETAAFIDEQVRVETRLVAVVVSIFTALAVLIGLLSRFD